MVFYDQTNRPWTDSAERYDEGVAKQFEEDIGVIGPSFFRRIQLQVPTGFLRNHDVLVRGDTQMTATYSLSGAGAN